MEDFPGGPVVKTPRSQCRGLGSIPGQGSQVLQLRLLVLQPKIKILHAATKTQHSRKKKKKKKKKEQAMQNLEDEGSGLSELQSGGPEVGWA